MTDIDKLVNVMARLRGPGGCPWDREQDRESLKPMLIEEAYETLHALDSDEPEDLREELGDLLLQIVFHARIAEEKGEFDMQGVVDAIYDKILHRHPHVFGDVKAETSRDVLENWDRLKKRELEKKNKARNSVLDGVPPKLPPLQEAVQLGYKASRTGFDWDDASGVLAKVREETAELEEKLTADDREGLKEEAGDLLFAVVNFCRFVGVDPETALKRANNKFRDRFAHVERQVRATGKPMEECSLAELEKHWQDSKQ